MANMSNYLEQAILNHVLRGSAYSAPATIYVGIVTDSATDVELEAGTLTNEITGYTGNRKSVTWSVLAASEGKTQTLNSNEVNFVSVPACTLKYLILVDAATGGNILWWTELVAQKTVNAGDTVTIEIGTVTVNID